MHASTQLVAALVATVAFLASAPARADDTLIAAVSPGPSLAARAVADNYEAALRNALQSAEHYPNSREARQLRPTGTVALWIEVGRDGSVLGTGIQDRSSSPLLDDQALRSARSSRVPMPPAELFGASGSRRFVVAVEFLDPNAR